MLTYLNSVLALYINLPEDAIGPLKTFSGPLLSWLRPAAAEAAGNQDSIDENTKISWNSFGTSGESDQSCQSARAILLTAYRLLEIVHSQFREATAFHELIGPTIDRLRALRPQDAPTLPQHIQETHAAILGIYSCSSYDLDNGIKYHY